MTGLVKMMLTRLPNFDRWEAQRGHPMLSHPQFATENPEWVATAEQQRLALLDSGISSGTSAPHPAETALR